MAPTWEHCHFHWHSLTRHSRAPQFLVARHLNPHSNATVGKSFHRPVVQSALYSRQSKKEKKKKKKSPVHTHLGYGTQLSHNVLYCSQCSPALGVQKAFLSVSKALGSESGHSHDLIHTQHRCKDPGARLRHISEIPIPRKRLSVEPCREECV